MTIPCATPRSRKERNVVDIGQLGVSEHARLKRKFDGSPTTFRTPYDLRLELVKDTITDSQVGDSRGKTGCGPRRNSHAVRHPDDRLRVNEVGCAQPKPMPDVTRVVDDQAPGSERGQVLRR